MKYYDTCIGKKYLHTNPYYSLTDKKVIEGSTDLIEITRETSAFLYGVSWKGRYKYNKKTGQWFHYHRGYGIWELKEGKFGGTFTEVK